MGSSWGCLSNSSQAGGLPCLPHTIHSPLPLAAAVVFSRRHPRCHPFPTSPLEPAAFRSPAERLLALTVCSPEIGCRIRQPFSAGSHTTEVWQIEYPRPIPGRSETPVPENRLQHTAALKEIRRSVYF